MSGLKFGLLKAQDVTSGQYRAFTRPLDEVVLVTDRGSGIKGKTTLDTPIHVTHGFRGTVYRRAGSDAQGRPQYRVMPEARGLDNPVAFDRNGENPHCTPLDQGSYVVDGDKLILTNKKQP